VYLAGTAQLLELNGTVIVELVAFLIMLAVLARWVYPAIVQQAESRQKQIAEQLAEAENDRRQAEAHLKDAEGKLNDARKTAQGLIEAATKSANQLRQELKQKAEDEAKRLTEAARKEIDAERERAVLSVRAEVAGLVVAATEKVLGETLDAGKHRQLIDRAIAEVASGDGSR
jgi:F-type H+-transporting ATPase subunit b